MLTTEDKERVAAIRVARARREGTLAVGGLELLKGGKAREIAARRGEGVIGRMLELPQQESLEVSLRRCGMKRTRTSSAKDAMKDFMRHLVWVFTCGGAKTCQETWYPRKPESH